MDSFKEFLGKDFDDCIDQALQYYACPRENLEVEIVQDAKSGIFGIVGARKAKIRARRARLAEAVANLLGFEEQERMQGQQARKTGKPPVEKTAKREMAQLEQQREGAPAQGAAPAKAPPVKLHAKAAREKTAKMEKARPQREKTERQEEGQAQKPPHKKAPRQEKPARLAPAQPESEQAPAQACQDQACLEAEDIEGAWPVRPIEELDQALLAQKALEIVGALLTPIAGKETAMRMETARGGVRVHVDWEGDAGLLIGREGQTLAAVQYLASRMLSRIMASSLRVQVDIGDYRARQDDKLRELAKTLAERARQAGRPFSTRPLSSYHRRVIHLVLQDYEDIQTRSIGEGPQKRVLIAPRRPCPQ